MTEVSSVKDAPLLFSTPKVPNDPGEKYPQNLPTKMHNTCKMPGKPYVILYYSTCSKINIYEYLVFFTETTDSDSASHHSYHRDDKGN